MITVSLSLALCTIMFRRFVDSFAGRVPIAIQGGTAPNTTALFMVSGALYYLYSHLKKGTLVRIGQGHPRHTICNSSHRTPIQKHAKNNSWFLRNAHACRKKCTDAMYRIAKQSYESLHNLNPCLLLPNKNFQIRFTKIKSDINIPENKSEDKGVCNIIFSNQAFSKDSSQDMTSLDTRNCGLQTSIELTEENRENGAIIKKRSKRGITKRLSEALKSRDNVNIKNFSTIEKNSTVIKRVTRSGKIYSRFE